MSSGPERKNLLGNETSPYLLQHRDNPVWWHPWGAEAFERAQREDKPVFLSVGYSTCYWCHVMEHDSFEQQAVADVLNAHFVSIKVDREEFPDVDQIYMDVVVGIHGHGGWPMSVFLAPDRRPFWGGTFFYRDTFIQILQGLAATWKNDRAKVDGSSAELLRYLESRQDKPGNAAVSTELLRLAEEQLLSRLDHGTGGFGGAPKFPPSQQLLFLMRMHKLQGDAASLEALRLTLSGMGRGGLFDQVGGGFHRYSVDAQWAIPHFEKMLYDNGILAVVYLEAYQMTKDELFRAVAAETLGYMVSEMAGTEGGFHSAEDAGEVEREGEFYAWTPQQVQAVLGEQESARICELLGISREGNFERGTSVPQVAAEGRWAETLRPESRAAIEKLRAARSERPRPHRDTKVLAGWNGLAITACARGFQVLGDAVCLAAARQAADFIFERMWSTEEGLKRRFAGGVAGIPAVLEDYVYLIEGLVWLFAATGEAKWLERAAALQDEQDRRLWSDHHKAYLSSASEGLIVQVCEWSDGATPAPNGVALSNLAFLAELTGEERFARRGAELESGVPVELQGYPAQFCSTLRGVMLRRSPPSVCVAIVPSGAPETAVEVKQLWSAYLPFTLAVAGAEGSNEPKLFAGRGCQGGKVTMYACRGQSCQQPTVEVGAAVDVCSAGTSFVGTRR